MQDERGRATSSCHWTGGAEGRQGSPEPLLLLPQLLWPMLVPLLVLLLLLLPELALRTRRHETLWGVSQAGSSAGDVEHAENSCRDCRPGWSMGASCSPYFGHPTFVTSLKVPDPVEWVCTAVEAALRLCSFANAGWWGHAAGSLGLLSAGSCFFLPVHVCKRLSPAVAVGASTRS